MNIRSFLPVLRAGGPGSGCNPAAGQCGRPQTQTAAAYKTLAPVASKRANIASKMARDASEKANKTNDSADHRGAAAAHYVAEDAHRTASHSWAGVARYSRAQGEEGGAAIKLATERSSDHARSANDEKEMAYAHSRSARI
jgi:hypothetical protein